MSEAQKLIDDVDTIIYDQIQTVFDGLADIAIR